MPLVAPGSCHLPPGVFTQGSARTRKLKGNHMAASINKVTLIGNIGQQPEVRYTPDGTAVTTISVATSETWKDKNSGDRREQTEWHRCEAWGKLAEIIGQYGEKGGLVYVEGSLKTEKYTDKDGVDRYTTKVRVAEFKFLGGRRQGGQQGDSNVGGDTGAGDLGGSELATGDDMQETPPAPKPTSGGGARAKFANRSSRAVNA